MTSKKRRRVPHRWMHPFSIQDKEYPCYACNNPSVSKDHAPPKSLFPKKFRRGLIQVRSCAAHNNGASVEDSYLSIISLLYDSDLHAHMVGPKLDSEFNTFSKKKLKTITSDESFRRPMGDSIRRLEIQGTLTSYTKSTARIDDKLLERGLIKIAKGLFSYHFKRWKPAPNFAVYTPEFLDRTNSFSYYNSKGQLCNYIRPSQDILFKHFLGGVKFGKYPDYFYYQTAICGNQILFRMCFYTLFNFYTDAGKSGVWR